MNVFHELQRMFPYDEISGGWKEPTSNTDHEIYYIACRGLNKCSPLYYIKYHVFNTNVHSEYIRSEPKHVYSINIETKTTINMEQVIKFEPFIGDDIV